MAVDSLTLDAMIGGLASFQYKNLARKAFIF
jgi:hypothetical protein